jgi:hypothetical protein
MDKGKLLISILEVHLYSKEKYRLVNITDLRRLLTEELFLSLQATKLAL